MGCSASKSVAVSPQPKPPKPPKEKPVPAVRHTPGGPVTQDDFVWSEKKKLIPDLSVFEEIDKRAISAPANLRTKPADLVAYLTADCKTELEKFRAIYRWIASHIDYDVEFLNTGRPGTHKVGDCLATGKAICAGYSGVVEELCGHADIQCESVSGVSKGGDYRVGDTEEFKISEGLPTHTDHAWIIVTINGKKFLCDPTWASGKTGSKDGKKVYNREWEECYFLAEPESFFDQHWPMGPNYTTATDKQLLKSPNKNFNDWLTRPHKKMWASNLGVNLISHKDGTIVSRENELDIEFSSKFQIAHYATIDIQNGNKWTKLEGFTLAYREGEKYKVRVRLPQGNAEYVLKILGKLPDAEGALAEQALFIVAYRIVCKADGNNTPYHSDFYTRAGLSADAVKKGFRLENHKGPLIANKSGKEAIVISVPNADPISLTCRLHGPGKDKLDSQIYLEKNDNKIVCNVRMYEKGEHAVHVFGDLNQEGSKSLASLGSFLINCVSPLPQKLPPYPKSRSVWGPTKLFNSLSIKDLNGPSSTKRAEKGGKCTLRFKVPSGVSFWPVTSDYADNNLEMPYTCAHLDADILTVMLRFPDAGNFIFGLYRKTGDNSLESVASFMVENDEAFTGDLFPKIYEVLGPRPRAAEVGLAPVDKGFKYYQKTSNSQCNVKFAATTKLKAFSVLNFKENRLSDCVKESVTEQEGKFVMSYDITFKDKGYYAFAIWENGSPTKQLVGMMIEYS